MCCRYIIMMIGFLVVFFPFLIDVYTSKNVKNKLVNMIVISWQMLKMEKKSLIEISRIWTLQ